MELYRRSLITSDHRKAVVLVRWARLHGETFVDLQIEPAVFDDWQQAEQFADFIIEAAAVMRGYQPNQLETK